MQALRTGAVMYFAIGYAGISSPGRAFRYERKTKSGSDQAQETIETDFLRHHPRIALASQLRQQQMQKYQPRIALGEQKGLVP